METNKPDIKIARKNTSVFVREDIWEELRITAIRRKITTSEAFERAIEQWVERAEKNAAKKLETNSAT